jgi:hypothetical protein
MRSRLTTLLVIAAVAATGAFVAASSEAAPAAGRTATLASGQKVYRGTGNRSLGTLRVTRTARLAWRHPSGGRFVLMTSARRGQQFPLVTTTFRTGSVRLRAGTYRGLRVVARGGWRITITTLRRR